ncbi:MAG: hypothetical protein HC850_01865 [Rhodomicrobium sp.]|nr:hypothetical protein [Rhodomicrobium sp.]
MQDLVARGEITEDGVKTIYAALSAYKSIDSLINAFSGKPGALGETVDNLNLLLANTLPADQVADVTRSVTGIKKAYETVQNVINGAQGEKDAWTKAAVSLFTNESIFGSDISKTAGQVVAGYSFIQNAVNFANGEVHAGDKALNAVDALAATGLIDQNLAKTIQGVGAGYKLVQNSINAINGEPLADVKAISAAQLLGNLGVLGPEVSKVIDTGVKGYNAVTSVIDLIKAPSIATGFGAVGAVANLIGGKTFGTIANIASIGFGIATGGIGAIVGGVLGLFGGLFGGGKKYTEISDQLDVNNDGAPDLVKFESKNDDWYYYVDAGALQVNNVGVELVRESNIKVDEDGRRYYEHDDGEGMRRSYGNYDDNAGERVLPDEVITYKLKANYNFERLNDAPSLEMPGSTAEVQITEAQYNDLAAQLGGTSATLAPSDARYNTIRQLAAPGGELKIRQEKKNEGMTWYADVNGDGIRDRMTKFVHLKKQTDGDDSTFIELRNASNQTYMSYAVDANGNMTDQGRAADRLRAAAPAASAQQLLGLDPAARLGDRVGAGASMAPGQYLLSNNGRYAAVMQSDGNFVVYDGNRGLWASATENRGGTQLAIQGDGNVVVYTADGGALWSTGTNGKGASTLIMQDDGNLVLYPDGGGGASWASNTVQSNSNYAAAPGPVGWHELPGGGGAIYGAFDFSKMPMSPETQLQALQYIASNPDLIAAFGADAGRGYQHLITNGAQENRQISFDPVAYMEANPDVKQAVGGDLAAATTHYITNGHNENRVVAASSQDVNGDGTPDRIAVYLDRVETSYTGSSGIETTVRYGRDGVFQSATGDFDNDGVRDQAILLPDGRTQITPTEGETVLQKIFGANGLEELVSDFNADGFQDRLQINPDNRWTAILGGADGTVLGTAIGDAPDIALENATLAVPANQLRSLEYIASYDDLMDKFGAMPRLATGICAPPARRSSDR